jgi:DNA-binding CsgD family transcriptional regulator
LADALLLDGDAAEARRLLESVETPVRQYGGPWFTTRWLLRVGHAALALGDAQAATGAFDEAVAVTTAQSLPWLRVLAVHGAGLAARQRGELATSEQHHHDALGAAMERRSLPVAVMALEGLGGLAIDADAAREGARLLAAAEKARTHMGLARPAWQDGVAVGDREAAERLLGADDFRAAWVEGEHLDLTEAVAYARRARGERKRPSSGWASLTPTEQQVAGLVANGLTNAQIAAAMFVAPSTVKTHLSNVFTKLGVSSRAEVAAEAIRQTG